jgi:hypothetical protein
MAGGKGCFGCFAALFGFVGFFLAIAISFSFYLIPIAFFLFIGSLILISLALGPTASSGPTPKQTPPPTQENPDSDK